MAQYVWNLHGDLINITINPATVPVDPSCQQIIADNRAMTLLRESCPEGAMLADGDGVLVPSKLFPAITYGVTPEEEGWIRLFHRLMGDIGDICIQSTENAPLGDILLTRLMLCMNDEKTLWTTGNLMNQNDDDHRFLPKTLRRWLEEKRKREEAEYLRKQQEWTEIARTTAAAALNMSYTTTTTPTPTPTLTVDDLNQMYTRLIERR